MKPKTQIKSHQSPIPQKVDGAQSSIKKKHIQRKDINSWAWCFAKGPLKYSHNLGLVMGTHTCITFSSKPTKRNMTEERGIVYVKYEGWQVTHEDKMPKTIQAFPREGDHQYVPCPKIKPHPKNVWQSFKNPLAHPKCVDHLWLKCNLEEFLYLKRSLMDSKAYTLTLSSTKINCIERWSKVWVISFIGPMMWYCPLRMERCWGPVRWCSGKLDSEPKQIKDLLKDQLVYAWIRLNNDDPFHMSPM
jgi:hypothetical protein